MFICVLLLLEVDFWSQCLCRIMGIFSYSRFFSGRQIARKSSDPVALDIFLHFRFDYLSRDVPQNEVQFTAALADELKNLI